MLRFSFRRFVAQALQWTRRPLRRSRRGRSAAVQTLEARTLLSVTLVRDLRPSPLGQGPNNLTEVNGTLFFAVNDGSNGSELWKSDGTSTGTVLVKDIISGSGSSTPDSLTNVNGTLYFRATDGTTGYELWKSDGTSTGTVLVKDIRSGSGSSTPDSLTNVNGTLYFRATDGSTGYELWKSDGTSAGTVLVKDIRSLGNKSFPELLTNVNGTLYFRANDGSTGYELWRSDGTSSGTVLVKDIFNGSGSSNSYRLTNVNGTLYFQANDGSTGHELWKSDGTSTGTVLVQDIRSGGGSSNPGNLINMNGTLYFWANDGSTGYELWRSDGTLTSTVLVKDIRSGFSSYPGDLTNVNGTLFFSANHGGTGRVLWKSDGTSTGTVLVKEIPSGNISSNLFNLTNVNGSLYFQANDGSTGYELWKSDGTSSGTVLVQDIRSGSDSSDPQQLTNVGGTLYFRANDGVNGAELWRTVDNTTPTDLTLSATSIPENQAIGTSLGTFSTTDPDAGNTFSYSLVSGSGSTDNASFTIDGGTLKTAASFDYETKSSYSIRVRSTDQGGLWVEQQFTITVTNVNETPTNIILSASSIAENLSVGTAVGGFSTTDPDAGNTFSYSLVSGTGSTDNGSFTIDGGTLKTAASFDYETKNNYSIRVRSTDQEGLWAETQVTITVTDGNDVPTSVSLANVVSVLLASANTSSAIRLADVVVTDDGLGTNTFSLSGADASVFEVVGGQLRLKAGTVLNYATQKSYTVTVNVDDTSLGSTPDVSVNYTLNLQGLEGTTVQNGAGGRSYVRYVSLNFGGTQGLAEAVATVGTASSRIRLFFGGTSGTQAVAKTLMAGMVSLEGNQVKLDFGVEGVGGDRNSSLGDGIYRLRVDLDGDGVAEITGTFFRLFGDVDGNGVVNDADIALVTTAQGTSGLNLATDLNGDGLVNAFDLTNIRRRRGARVAWS
jgi:ELWxxDGT repeat protein